MMLNLLAISEVCSDENVIRSADSKHNVLKLMSISDQLQVANSNVKPHEQRMCPEQNQHMTSLFMWFYN